MGSLGERNDPANRLLCFVLVGLSTAYRIPVAYYFTRQLNATELHKLTLVVIREVEAVNFNILRLVCDDFSQMSNCLNYSATLTIYITK